MGPLCHMGTVGHLSHMSPGILLGPLFSTSIVKFFSPSLNPLGPLCSLSPLVLVLVVLYDLWFSYIFLVL